MHYLLRLNYASDLFFNALGTTDELSSHLGLVREFACEAGKSPHPYVDELQRIQCLLQEDGMSRCQNPCERGEIIQ